MGFNPFAMAQGIRQAAQNPQQAVRGMVTAQARARMLEQWRQDDPETFGNVQAAIRGRGGQELLDMARNIARQKGIDLAAFAAQYGIQV